MQAQELTDSLAGANPDAEVTFSVDGAPVTFAGATVEGGQVTVNLTAGASSAKTPGSKSSS